MNTPGFVLYAGVVVVLPRFNVPAALTWQPGSWAVRPLLVTYNTGHALLVQAEGDAQDLPVDTGLSSCVAAKWSPSGTLAALLGLPALGATSLEVFPAVAPQALSASLSQHGATSSTLLLVQACGTVTASLDLARSDPRALAWTDCGEYLAATAEQDLFIMSLRSDFMCCSYGEDTLAAVGPLLLQQLVELSLPFLLLIHYNLD